MCRVMDKRHTSFGPSSELIAAQTRLEQLREKLQAEREACGDSVLARPVFDPTPAKAKPTLAELGQVLLEQRRQQSAGLTSWRLPEVFRVSVPHSEPESLSKQLQLTRQALLGSVTKRGHRALSLALSHCVTLSLTHSVCSTSHYVLC